MRVPTKTVMLTKRFGVGYVRRPDRGLLFGWMNLTGRTLFYAGPWCFGFILKPKQETA